MEKRLTHAEKLRLSGIEKYGTEEAWREARAEYGREGGQARVKKGLATMSEERRREISILGAKKRWGK